MFCQTIHRKWMNMANGSYQIRPNSIKLNFYFDCFHFIGKSQSWWAGSFHNTHRSVIISRDSVVNRLAYEFLGYRWCLRHVVFVQGDIYFGRNIPKIDYKSRPMRLINIGRFTVPNWTVVCPHSRYRIYVLFIITLEMMIYYCIFHLLCLSDIFLCMFLASR